jgi:hypothetical protein
MILVYLLVLAMAAAVVFPRPRDLLIRLAVFSAGVAIGALIFRRKR